MIVNLFREKKREKSEWSVKFFLFIFSLVSRLFWTLRPKVVEIIFVCFICYCLIFILYHNYYYWRNRLSQSRRWPTPFWLNETEHLSVSMQKYWLKVFEHISSFSFQLISLAPIAIKCKHPKANAYAHVPLFV